LGWLFQLAFSNRLQRDREHVAQFVLGAFSSQLALKQVQDPAMHTLIKVAWSSIISFTNALKQTQSSANNSMARRSSTATASECI
jgi:hypothetical protein